MNDSKKKKKTNTVNLKLWPENITDIKQKSITTCEYHKKDQQNLQEHQSTSTSNYGHISQLS